MKPLVSLALFFALAVTVQGQVLPWRYHVEKRLDHNERLIELLLQQQQQPTPQVQPQPIIIASPWLPIEGSPKQTLPIEGSPKQTLPQEGSPRQTLPVSPPLAWTPQRYSTFTPALWRPQ